MLQHALNSKKSIIDIRNAGTSLRFNCISIYTRKTRIYINGSRIQERPIKELVEVLNKLGGNITSLNNDERPPLKIKGTKIKGGNIEIKGDISSQFITNSINCPTLENEPTKNKRRVSI